MRRAAASPIPRIRALCNRVSQERMNTFRHMVTEMFPAFGIQRATPGLLIYGNAAERAERAGDCMKRDLVAPTVRRQFDALLHGKRDISAIGAEPFLVVHTLLTPKPTWLTFIESLMWKKRRMARFSLRAAAEIGRAS